MNPAAIILALLTFVSTLLGGLITLKFKKVFRSYLLLQQGASSLSR